MKTNKLNTNFEFDYEYVDGEGGLPTLINHADTGADQSSGRIVKVNGTKFIHVGTFRAYDHEQTNAILRCLNGF
jgi:hypothetical protein